MAMVLFVSMVFAATLLVYWNSRAKAIRSSLGSMRASAAFAAVSANALNLLYAGLVLLFVLSAALLFTLGENMMFIIPLACATAAIVLWRLTSLKAWLVIAVALILLHAFSFLYALAMALTIGALGAVAMIAFLDFVVLIPLSDLYCGIWRADR
jgi:hypothetical protein